jgi:hypothetical protein
MKVLKVIRTWVKTINPHLLWIVAVLVCVFCSLLWSWQHPHEIITDHYIEVPQIQEVIQIQKVPIYINKVIVLDKSELIKKVPGLPQSFIDNPKEQVTTTGQIKPSRTNTNVLSVINTDSGASHMLAKTTAPKLMGFVSDKSWGGRYGYDKNGQRIEVFGQVDFFRVGPAYIGGYVEAGSSFEKPKLELEGMVTVSFKSW